MARDSENGMRALQESLDSWVRSASTQQNMISLALPGPNCRMQAEHLVEDLQHVEKLVESMQSGLYSAYTLRARMRRHTNFCAPVNKLPVEVLRIIYIMCVSGAPPLGEHQEIGVGHPCFIISHICSHWRAVSLDFPFLWSHIRLSELPSDFQDAILQRTKNHPLEVWLDLHPPLSESLSKLNMNLLCRAKTLNMQVPAHIDSAFIEFLATPPAFAYAYLETFSLQLSPQNPMSNQVHLVLQHPIFAGYTPRLRHLSLEGVRMPWSRGFYSNLTTLRLTSCEAGSHVSQDHDICSILQDSPQIEDLEISLYRSQFPMSDPIPRHPHERISLPTLRALKLFCGLGYIRHLLPSIDARALDTIDIRIRDLYPDHFQAALSEGGMLPSAIASKLAKIRVEIGAHDLEIKFVGLTAGGRTVYALTWCFLYHPALSELCSFLRNMHTPLRELEIVSEENETLPSIWTEHPRSFAACLQVPSIESLSLVGDITSVLLPQMLQNHTLIAGAEGWPQLAQLGVRAKLESDAVTTLAAWCAQRPALRSLDFSGSVMHVASAASIPAVVSMFQNHNFVVDWSNCQFHDNSAQHTLRHPEALWPHLFRPSRPRRRSPLQHVLSADYH